MVKTLNCQPPYRTGRARDIVVKQAHILLTYTCTLECDHCFLYSSPEAEGTFTLSQIRRIYDELSTLGTIEWVYFEGGEPFLFYPLMLEGLRIASDRGFKTGIVTNSYWATSVEDAELWLRPIAEVGVSDLSVSDDAFHYEEEENPPKRVVEAAKALGIPVNSISIENPGIEGGVGDERDKGEPITGGSVRFRGRAVEKLAEGLPGRPWDEFTECGRCELEDPRVVHLDPYGNVHLCQGLSMGNMWETPLSRLVEEYDAASHPICGPLVRGGPAQLVREYGVAHDDEYIEADHLCYLTRLALIDRFPEYIAPRQCYGLGRS
jgi:MoaA/NifB/PqqE/SkfB family radical SAM enzyme